MSTRLIVMLEAILDDYERRRAAAEDAADEAAHKAAVVAFLAGRSPAEVNAAAARASVETYREAMRGE